MSDDFSAPEMRADGDMVTDISPGGFLGFGVGSDMFKNMGTFGGDVLYTPPKMSGNRETYLGRDASIRAARQAERTHEHIRGGIERKVNTVVGTALKFRSKIDWRLLGLPSTDETLKWAASYDRRREALFNEWGYDRRLLADAEGHYNFGGLMWLSNRNLNGPDAETAGVIHYDMDRARDYGTRWGTFVTVLDPDRVMTPTDKFDDKFVYGGRKLDAWGRWTGIYVLKGHPGETSLTSDNFELVPRQNQNGRPMAWHWFKKTRGGAQRGLTALITVLRQSTMVDKLDDANLGAALLEAILAVSIQTSSSPETAGEKLAPATSRLSDRMSLLDRAKFYEASRIRVGGNRVPVLAEDDKLVMQAVGRIAADPSALRNGFMNAFASSIGTTAEMVTKDYTRSTYSSIRAGLEDWKRDMLAERGMFTDHVPSQVADALTEEMIVKGWLSLDDMPGGPQNFYENRAAYTACDWTGPSIGQIDPLKETLAAGARIALRLSDTPTEAAALGNDSESILERESAFRKMADKLDVPIGTPMQITMEPDTEEVTATVPPPAPASAPENAR